MAIFIQLPQKQHVFATPRIWALVDFYFIWGVQYSDLRINYEYYMLYVIYDIYGIYDINGTMTYTIWH